MSQSSFLWSKRKSNRFVLLLLDLLKYNQKIQTHTKPILVVHLQSSLAQWRRFPDEMSPGYNTCNNIADCVKYRLSESVQQWTPVAGLLAFNVARTLSNLSIIAFRSFPIICRAASCNTQLSDKKCVEGGGSAPTWRQRLPLIHGQLFHKIIKNYVILDAIKLPVAALLIQCHAMARLSLSTLRVAMLLELCLLRIVLVSNIVCVCA